ncbi:hypothetical protein HNY73_020197 [Argiope bruennichi]|uniref:Uncharacterized protein n=1 Tax=Argiope bruennichi TaxID=94029 RepID=A0A8T0E9T2_ARGBR|nr:hypothetical protein HNY73_020197 [Argiope bruennichi]
MRVWLLIRLGEANTVITADLIGNMDDLVRSDWLVTLRLLTVKMDVSVGIVHDRLSEGVHAVASETADRPTQGTQCGVSSSTSVSAFFSSLTKQRVWF